MPASSGLLIIVVVAGMAGYVAYLTRQRRIAALKAFASEIGFTYSARDPGRVLSAPFRLFKRGSRPKTQDFVCGAYNGLHFQTFEFQYTVSNGKSSRTYWHTCVIVNVGFAAPLLGIGQENVMTRLGSRLGIRDVEFESSEFNQTFRVHCDDQRFAFSLVDPRMMEWLMTRALDSEAIEIAGNWVMFAYSKQLPAKRRELIEIAGSFVANIPSVVYTAYPPT